MWKKDNRLLGYFEYCNKLLHSSAYYWFHRPIVFYGDLHAVRAAPASPTTPSRSWPVPTPGWRSGQGHGAPHMDLSGDDLKQFAEADRREVAPPIQVETASWSPGGQLDRWVRERREWWGRVRVAGRPATVDQSC
jgi:hypothetical protein